VDGPAQTVLDFGLNACVISIDVNAHESGEQQENYQNNQRKEDAMNPHNVLRFL
jgi:hypothetical protein